MHVLIWRLARRDGWRGGVHLHAEVLRALPGARVVDRVVADGVNTLGTDGDGVALGRGGRAVDGVVGAVDVGEVVIGLETHCDRRVDPAAGDAGGRRGRRGAVDLDAVDGRGGRVTGLVADAGGGGQVAALSLDDGVGRAGDHAGQVVGAGPDDGDVVGEPALAVRGADDLAGDGGRGLVDVDHRGGHQGAVAGGVGRGRGVRLGRALAEGVRLVLSLDAGQRVGGGVGGGDVVAVPAVGVGPGKRVDGDDGLGLVDADLCRVGRGVARVVLDGSGYGLCLA